MKRPLYYLFCAIACTSMVGATMPMAAIAEVMQPQATAEQQAQADATSSDTGKAEDGTNTNATANTVGDSTATSTGTSAVNTENAAGTTAATGAPAPSLRAQTNPTPEAISATSQTTYAHSATATQNGVTFTVSWNDAPAGTATTFHVTQTNGSSQAKARMDVPTYWDGGSQESVCDPSRPAWASYYSLGTAGHDFTFDFTASGTYRIYFYFMDNDRNDPQNDKGDLLPAHHGGGDRKRRRPPKRHEDRQRRRGPVQATDKRLGIRHGAVAPRLDARPAGVRPQPQLVRRLGPAPNIGSEPAIQISFRLTSFAAVRQNRSGLTRAQSHTSQHIS